MAYLKKPLDTAGRDAMRINLWLYVEHRYITDIVAGMEDAGLIVKWW